MSLTDAWVARAEGGTAGGAAMAPIFSQPVVDDAGCLVVRAHLGGELVAVDTLTGKQVGGGAGGQARWLDVWCVCVEGGA